MAVLVQNIAMYCVVKMFKVSGEVTIFKLRALLIIAVVWVACGFCFTAAAETSAVEPGGPQVSEADDRLSEEANRLAAELSKQGFLVPYVVTPDGLTKFELFVAEDDKEHEISLWFATLQGKVAIELRDPKQQLLVSWQGTRGEWRLKQKLDPGKYLVDVQAMDGAHVHGVIGIKGPATGQCCPAAGQCDFDSNRLTEQAPDPPRYLSPYLLVRPMQRAADASTSVGAGTLFVVPNNTGFESVDGELLRASAICELKFGADTGPAAIADRLGAPLLMPLFPRPKKLYLQALTRASLKNSVAPEFYRVDKQLIAMIDDARAKLASMNRSRNLSVQPSVLMAGFSASGVFTNRFAVLHPKRVLAAAVGAPGGWPIAPVGADQGETLPYPVGIADLGTKELGGEPVDIAALRRVRFLFLLGDADTNDAVACLDSFSETDADQINRLFGGLVGRGCGKAAETVVKRWWPAQRLYHAAGLNARFRLYPDVRHEDGLTAEMWNDILDTFRKAVTAR